MKKIASSTLVGLAAVVLTAANLSAQVCNGTAPFSAGKMRVGAGVRMPDGGTFLDGEFAVGTKSGLFGGANISLFDPEVAGADGSTFFGGFLGKTMMIDAKKTVEMCPQGFLMLGDDFNQFGGGVSFGKHFVQTSAGSIDDDHVPLLRRGLRVIDVIDLQYGPVRDGRSVNYHHTTLDTIDKVSARSLQVVGDVATALVTGN